MTKKLNGFFEITFFALLIALSLVLSLGSGYKTAVLGGINLWVACVIPSLFPYFFITTILSSLKITGKFGNLFAPLTKTFFNCGKSVGYALFISILSGYPIGAKTVSDLKNDGLLSNGESVRAACLCSTSSPMFLISSVGGIMFNSTTFGLKLFFTHLISSIIVGVIFSFYRRKDKPLTNLPNHTKKLDNVLYESAYSSVISILIVGALITIFYLLTEILLSLGVLSPLINLLDLLFNDRAIAESIVFGLFECTKGLKTLSAYSVSWITFPVAAAICGFGGVSVIAQSIAYLKTAKIKTAPFLLSKVTAAVINFVLALLVSFVFPV